MNHLIKTLVLAITLAGCVIEVDGEDGPDDPGPGTDTPSYSNRVYLECNGGVLVDRTFTSKNACLDFKASNEFYCGPVKMSFSC